jgi:hypothetical protein
MHDIFDVLWKIGLVMLCVVVLCPSGGVVLPACQNCGLEIPLDGKCPRCGETA